MAQQPDNRPKVLVTGASGLIGGLTVRTLADKYNFSGLQRRPVEGIPSTIADIADLDASVGQADLIVIHQVLHYFDDPGRTLAQTRRALRPGGEMLIVDFAPHELEFLRSHHAHRRLGLGEQQMASWARAAGLRVAGLTTFPPTNGTGLTVCLWRLADDSDGSSDK